MKRTNYCLRKRRLSRFDFIPIAGAEARRKRATILAEVMGRPLKMKGVASSCKEENAGTPPREWSTRNERRNHEEGNKKLPYFELIRILPFGQWGEPCIFHGKSLYFRTENHVGAGVVPKIGFICPQITCLPDTDFRGFTP